VLFHLSPLLLPRAAGPVSNAERCAGSAQAQHAVLAAALPDAEISLLAHIGFQSLPDIGWEWRVLHTFEQRLRMQSCPGWLTAAPPDNGTDVAPETQELTGRQLAVQFLVDWCVHNASLA
jgi:hypothetical protein